MSKILELMVIREKNNATSDGVTQMFDDKDVTTLFQEMQITFPDKVSHEIYHNAIHDYYESLNKILRQYASTTGQ